jgi:hypothetical protein
VCVCFFFDTSGKFFERLFTSYFNTILITPQAPHKDLYPLDSTDYFGFLCATFGLILASGGGIGGGGMLVPIYVLVMVN